MLKLKFGDQEKNEKESGPWLKVTIIIGIAGIIGFLWYLGSKAKKVKDVVEKKQESLPEPRSIDIEASEEVSYEQQEEFIDDTDYTESVEDIDSIVPYDPAVIPNYMYGDPIRCKPKSKAEATTKEIVEKMFNREFFTVRPPFLQIPKEYTRTGTRTVCVELDLFNRELMLAIEYNGIQHYIYPNVWDRDYETFESRRAYDLLKTKACRRYNVYLIVVPYTVSPNAIKDFIYERLPPDLKEIAII